MSSDDSDDAYEEADQQDSFFSQVRKHAYPSMKKMQQTYSIWNM